VIIPIGIGLMDWSASLLIDYPDDNLPILYTEENWKDWGNVVIGAPSFDALNAPPTDGYDNWQDWAMALYQAAGFVQG
jgi:hypothetical protein